MSTSEEIAEVYAGDIVRQSRVVFGRKGIMPFLAGVGGMYVFDVYKEAFKLREVLDAISLSGSEEKISPNGRE